MYTIGDFSKINRITPKTLRHYDRIGLLKPARTDDWTGYRYYSAAQLPLIKRILILKELAFSLAEIQAILNEEANLTALLQRREAELEQSISEENARLKRVREYLQRIKGAEKMNQEVTMKSLPAVTVASMRTTVPGYDTFFEIIPRMGDYMRSVGAVCREPAYCFTIYHNGEYREHDIDVEICEAVTEPRQESEKIKFKTIAQVPVAACMYHRGPYSRLRDTYNALFSWIDEQGWTAIDNPRESYIDGIWNKEDPEDWLTEIQVPAGRKSGRA